MPLWKNGVGAGFREMAYYWTLFYLAEADKPPYSCLFIISAVLSPMNVASSFNPRAV